METKTIWAIVDTKTNEPIDFLYSLNKLYRTYCDKKEFHRELMIYQDKESCVETSINMADFFEMYNKSNVPRKLPMHVNKV